MIVIFTEKNDQSTCHVIDWLLFFKKEFIVITESDFIEILELSPSGNFILKINGIIIASQDITSVWYRRGGLKLKQIKTPIFQKDNTISILFERFNNMEKAGIIDFINFTFLEKKCLNNQLFSSVNKLQVLYFAIQAGLNIPKSILTSEKKKVTKFLQDNDKVITKPAVESMSLSNNNFHFVAYTTPISDQSLLRYEADIPLSFFQKQIEKEFELRIFFLDNKFYSMAIFSQNNKKTKIDFRHYDNSCPNRSVPFHLPSLLRMQLKKLLFSLHINCASIDMIYGKDKIFYFLEVNPIGQFGMTSYPCNYYLEKKIASFLSNIN
jgi:ATP-GRASP peptide maturase of grasp-with-spasm system